MKWTNAWKYVKTGCWIGLTIESPECCILFILKRSHYFTAYDHFHYFTVELKATFFVGLIVISHVGVCTINNSSVCKRKLLTQIFKPFLLSKEISKPIYEMLGIFIRPKFLFTLFLKLPLFSTSMMTSTSSTLRLRLYEVKKRLQPKYQ
jgi:hypothetical protein